MPRRIQPQGRERGSSLISTATVPVLVPCPRETADGAPVEGMLSVVDGAGLDGTSSAGTAADAAELSAGADRLVAITSFACSWGSCASSCEEIWRVMRYSGGGCAGAVSGPSCELDASEGAAGATGMAGATEAAGATGATGATGDGSGGGAEGRTAGADGGEMPTGSPVGSLTPRKSA
jgi:hypothetical protein